MNNWNSDDCKFKSRHKSLQWREWSNRFFPHSLNSLLFFLRKTSGTIGFDCVILWTDVYKIPRNLAAVSILDILAGLAKSYRKKKSRSETIQTKHLSSGNTYKTHITMVAKNARVHTDSFISHDLSPKIEKKRTLEVRTQLELNLSSFSCVGTMA